MKLKTFLRICSITFLILGGNGRASAGSFTTTFTPSLAIPDNDPNGVADTQSLTVPGVNTITSLEVSIAVSGGFNGDYYAYLRHGDKGFAVLLNRAGLTSANPDGYADSGFDITLSDSAPNGDVHLYEAVLDPNGAALTGQWQPDGRNIDPSLVLDSTARTTDLAAFNGMDPNGSWTLFISDNAPLGAGALAGWGLTLTGDFVPIAAVPEDCSTLALLFLSCLALALPRLRRAARAP